jgi:hypothetical protein
MLTEERQRCSRLTSRRWRRALTRSSTGGPRLRSGGGSGPRRTLGVLSRPRRRGHRVEYTVTEDTVLPQRVSDLRGGPTLGRIPHASDIEPVDAPISIPLMLVEGPMGRRVADLRAALEAMAGASWRDPWSVPAPLRAPNPYRPFAWPVSSTRPGRAPQSRFRSVSARRPTPLPTPATPSTKSNHHR